MAAVHANNYIVTLSHTDQILS